MYIVLICIDNGKHMHDDIYITTVILRVTSPLHIRIAEKFTGLHVNSARHWLTEVDTVRILAFWIPNKT